MDDLNDFGFSTVSESDFTASAKEPETKVVEAAAVSYTHLTLPTTPYV